MFRKYPKIYRLGHEDTDGILAGHCFIQEKVDGANASIWLEDGVVQTGSRGRVVTNEGFNGFTEYAQGHVGIQELLTTNPDWRLYGEWLVRHTVSYNETAYKHFYLYDIFYNFKQDETTEHEVTFDRISPDQVVAEAIEHVIKSPKIFAYIENPTVEQLEKFVGESEIGEIGEGVVIKNMDFINKWGKPTYAKIVTEKFKENNALVFGGNNKHSDCYHEMWCVNSFMTLARVQKIMNKIQPLVDQRLDMEHTARVIHTCYNDLINEEIWTIQKKCRSINFRTLARLSMKKAAQIYHDILNDNLSVADVN